MDAEKPVISSDKDCKLKIPFVSKLSKEAKKTCNFQFLTLKLGVNISNKRANSNTMIKVVD